MPQPPQVEKGCAEAKIGAAAEINRLHQKIEQLKKQTIAAEKRRDQAEVDAARSAGIADRAERAERQIAAERDRWKRLALAYESELRSLVPHYHAAGA